MGRSSSKLLWNQLQGPTNQSRCWQQVPRSGVSWVFEPCRPFPHISLVQLGWDFSTMMRLSKGSRKQPCRLTSSGRETSSGLLPANALEGPLLIQNAGRDLFDATSKSGVDLSSAIRRVEEGVRHGLRNQAEGLPHEPKAILNIMRHKPWSDCGCTWFELRSIAESEGVAQDKSPAAIDTV